MLLTYGLHQHEINNDRQLGPRPDPSADSDVAAASFSLQQSQATSEPPEPSSEPPEPSEPCHVAMMIDAKNGAMTTVTATTMTGQKARGPDYFVDANQITAYTTDLTL